MTFNLSPDTELLLTLHEHIELFRPDILQVYAHSNTLRLTGYASGFFGVMFLDDSVMLGVPISIRSPIDSDRTLFELFQSIRCAWAYVLEDDPTGLYLCIKPSNLNETTEKYYAIRISCRAARLLSILQKGKIKMVKMDGQIYSPSNRENDTKSLSVHLITKAFWEEPHKS